MKYNLWYFALLFGTCACTEFFSQSAEGIILGINSPKDSLFAQPGVITFWWEKNGAAEGYHLQVVNPNFDNPTVILDTLMENHQIEVLHEEGVYTWRIRVENEGSESIWQQRFFVLDETAPFGARPGFPSQGDTLSAVSFSYTLSWRSNDPPIDGFSFPVVDSIYLYTWRDSVLTLIDQYVQMDRLAEKQLDISGAVVAPLPGDTLHYRWLVKSFDQAGNTKLSETFSFSLFQ